MKLFRSEQAKDMGVTAILVAETTIILTFRAMAAKG
jgi:hypothetical protein